MSLSRTAARMSAVRALRGATLANSLVFDSAIDPIDAALREHRAPIIIVMTDDDEIEPTGQDIQHGEQGCDLVIEIAVAGRATAEADDGEGGSITLEIPQTDAGMDLTLDILEFQVTQVLKSAVSPWARAFRAIAARATKRLSRRGVSADGTKFAARQIVLTLDLIDTPTGGAEIIAGSAWDVVLSVMDGDTETAGVADLLRAMIEGAPLADWRRAAGALGVSKEAIFGIGLGQSLDPDQDPATLDEVVATEDGSPDISLTADEADAQGQ